MKKVWLALAGMILAFSASAAQITDGKQYTTLDKPVQGEPQVLEFRAWPIFVRYLSTLV